MRLPLKLRWHDQHRAADTLVALNRVQAVIEFRGDGTILDANPLFLETLGYRLDEVVGRHHRMFVDADYAESDGYARFWEELNQGLADTGLYRRLRKDGSEVWLQSSYNPIRDAAGHIKRIVKFATDVSVQQARAADMDSRLRAIDRAQAVIEFGLDGTILDANRNFLRAVGYQLEDVVGRHHRMFVAASEAGSPEYASFWNRLRSGAYESAVYRRFGAGDRVVWIQASYNPVLDAGGRVSRIIKYATDITRQTLAAQILQTEVRGLSDTVIGNADIADIANRRAIDARRAATRGGAVVGDVVRSMNTIHEGMDEISEIVDLIDAIAFQTHLLALNATVEAARAGPAGRGFAVVAEEVRHLASRSKNAARQVHQHIGKAGERVGEGATAVQSAGSAMQDIRDAVGDMVERVDEIRQSAALQASNIQRVREAISHLESVYGHS